MSSRRFPKTRSPRYARPERKRIGPVCAPRRDLAPIAAHSRVLTLHQPVKPGVGLAVAYRVDRLSVKPRAGSLSLSPGGPTKEAVLKLEPRDLISVHRQLLSRRDPSCPRLHRPAPRVECRAIARLVRLRGLLDVYAVLVWAMAQRNGFVTSLVHLADRFDELAALRHRAISSTEVAA